jgi:hypothetical protein
LDVEFTVGVLAADIGSVLLDAWQDHLHLSFEQACILFLYPNMVLVQGLVCARG